MAPTGHDHYPVPPVNLINNFTIRLHDLSNLAKSVAPTDHSLTQASLALSSWVSFYATLPPTSNGSRISYGGALAKTIGKLFTEFPSSSSTALLWMEVVHVSVKQETFDDDDNVAEVLSWRTEVGRVLPESFRAMSRISGVPSSSIKQLKSWVDVWEKGDIFGQKVVKELLGILDSGTFGKVAVPDETDNNDIIMNDDDNDVAAPPTPTPKPTPNPNPPSSSPSPTSTISTIEINFDPNIKKQPLQLTKLLRLFQQLKSLGLTRDIQQSLVLSMADEFPKDDPKLLKPAKNLKSSLIDLDLQTGERASERVMNPRNGYRHNIINGYIHC